MDQRIKKYISDMGSLSENVSFGWAYGKDVVL